MNRKQRIQSILNNNFKEYIFSVIDNSYEHKGHNNFDGTQESHYKIILNNNNKNKINRLDIHRKIHSLLEIEFSNGMHALEINIL